NRHPHPLRPAGQGPGADQEAGQGGRPRLRLLRGDPAGRVPVPRSARPVRRPAGGLRPGDRALARGAGPGALRPAVPPAVGGGGLLVGPGRLRYGVAVPNSVVIGLSAVVVAIRDGDAVVLTVRPRGQKLPSLPFGPFDPDGHRTFELALRAF